MANWSCFFSRCEGSETAFKAQQGMTQTAGTCGQVGHGVQPGARGHVLRRPLHEDLIQCSKVEPNHWIFQATPSQSGIARTRRPRGQNKGAGKPIRDPYNKVNSLGTLFSCKLLTSLHQSRGRAKQPFLLIPRFPSTALPFSVSPTPLS